MRIAAVDSRHARMAKDAVRSEEAFVSQLLSMVGIENVLAHCGDLRPNHFTDPAYRWLFVTVRRHGVVDLNRIEADLRDLHPSEKLDFDSLARYLGAQSIDLIPVMLATDCASSAGTVAILSQRADEVRRLAGIRMRFRFHEQSMQRLLDPTVDVAALDEKLLANMRAIEAEYGGSARIAFPSLRSLRPDLDRRRERLQDPHFQVPVGFSPLAGLVGKSWCPGLHLLVGMPKSGKSQMALQEAHHAAAKGVVVLYVSLEMDVDQLEARILGAVGNVPWTDLLERADQRERIEVLRSQCDEMGVLANIGVHSAALGAVRVEELAHLVRRLRRQAGDRPCMLVVDYLQLVQSDGDPRIRVGDAAKELAVTGDAEGVPVLAISSVGRAHYSTCAITTDDDWRSPEEMMAVAKESGEAEYCAQNLLVIVNRYGKEGGLEESRIALATSRRRASGWCRGMEFSGGLWRTRNAVSCGPDAAPLIERFKLREVDSRGRAAPTQPALFEQVMQDDEL